MKKKFIFFCILLMFLLLFSISYSEGSTALTSWQCTPNKMVKQSSESYVTLCKKIDPSPYTRDPSIGCDKLGLVNLNRLLFNVVVGPYKKETGDGEIISQWGTWELETYLQNKNVLTADSKNGIKITANKTPYLYKYYNAGGKGFWNATSSFTSARLNTRNKESFDPGNGTIRIAVTAILNEHGSGVGVWPAIWMMPTNYAYGIWPASGEIDIAEFRGNVPNTVLGTAHFGDDFSNHGYRQGAYSGASFFDGQPHTFGIYWYSDKIKWFVNLKNSANPNDDQFYYTLNKTGPDSNKDANNPFEKATPFNNPSGKITIKKATWPFDKKFYLIFNIAVGGQFFNPSTPANDYYNSKTWAYKGTICNAPNLVNGLPASMTIKNISVTTI